MPPRGQLGCFSEDPMTRIAHNVNNTTIFYAAIPLLHLLLLCFLIRPAILVYQPVSLLAVVSAGMQLTALDVMYS